MNHPPRRKQENLVEAIERAAAALRVVHDESQSRELRSLITIRRVTGETSLSKLARRLMMNVHNLKAHAYTSQNVSGLHPAVFAGRGPTIC